MKGRSLALLFRSEVEQNARYGSFTPFAALTTIDRYLRIPAGGNRSKAAIVGRVRARCSLGGFLPSNAVGDISQYNLRAPIA